MGKNRVFFIRFIEVLAYGRIIKSGRRNNEKT